MNLPNYDFLPAPFLLITVLHLVTLSLHFVAMNFMLGGVIVVLWGKFNDRWNDPTVQKFVKLFPSVMAATISFGVAPLLFLQLVYPRQVYPAAIVSAWPWLMIIPVLIVAYYGFYTVSFSKKAGSGRKKLLLSLALLGLLYVSFVYSSVFSMAERPDFIKQLYAGNQSGLLINSDFGDYIFRWLHMVFGAMTVGGFFVAFLGRDNEQAFTVGKTFFIWGMALAALFGFIYLVSFGELLPGLMKSPAIYFLTIGIILSLGSLHFFFKKKLIMSGAMIFVSLLTMVTTRHYVRLLRLGEHYDPSSMTVSPQWSVFILFLIFFVVAIALIAYMLRLYSLRSS
jgi:hypothetical protein